MKKFFQDFKDFISKGNVLQLAVGIIIGAAFNKIVSSLVADMLTPIINLIFPGDATSFQTILRKATTEGGQDIILYWGRFIQSIIDFLIIGFTLFIIVRVATRAQRIAEQRKEAIRQKLAKGEDLTEDEKVEVEEPEEKLPTEEVLLLREIRDALATKQK